MIVGDELRHGERPGADRLLVERRPVDLVPRERAQDVLRDDRRPHHLIAERRVRLLEMVRDGQRVRGVDRGDLVEPRSVGDVDVLVRRELPGELDIRGGERRPVGPAHPGPQPEGPGQTIRADRVADGQRGDPLPGGVDGIEAVKRVAIHRAARRQTVQVGVQVVGIIADHHHEGPRGGPGGRARDRQDQEEERHSQRGDPIGHGLLLTLPAGAIGP